MIHHRNVNQLMKLRLQKFLRCPLGYLHFNSKNLIPQNWSFYEQFEKSQVSYRTEQARNKLQKNHFALCYGAQDNQGQPIEPGDSYDLLSYSPEILHRQTSTEKIPLILQYIPNESTWNFHRGVVPSPWFPLNSKEPTWETILETGLERLTHFTFLQVVFSFLEWHPVYFHIPTKNLANVNNWIGSLRDLSHLTFHVQIDPCQNQAQLERFRDEYQRHLTLKADNPRSPQVKLYYSLSEIEEDPSEVEHQMENLQFIFQNKWKARIPTVDFLDSEYQGLWQKYQDS